MLPYHGSHQCAHRFRSNSVLDSGKQLPVANVKPHGADLNLHDSHAGQGSPGGTPLSPIPEPIHRYLQKTKADHRFAHAKPSTDRSSCMKTWFCNEMKETLHTVQVYFLNTTIHAHDVVHYLRISTD
ncbi:hypothetical protein KP509_03G051300 [Ceratopteris richardii]|uniref:Uncharacterized protein n=1 Tax=Ceratopteris richardii TaxID=49495 RepID=A0A8T2V2W1_CERRI|nr:hypothetical protein KP509_03G051300 [Ceratopteris richardii]KAH7441732.1 hypothetical protein KP509_03G051300 [Ceratopteris richardii]